MKEKRDYIRDIEEIRSMMERSSKFMSLSGLAGIMAGIYALAGAYMVIGVYGFNPDEAIYRTTASGGVFPYLQQVLIVAVAVLVLAVTTAIALSGRKATKRGEKAWNDISRRLLINMAVPLCTGGILILIFISKGLLGLIAPATLLFYGLALYNASHLTFNDIKFLGLSQVVLGLIGFYYISFGLICWAIGFGVMHIVYGIYMYIRYER